MSLINEALKKAELARQKEAEASQSPASHQPQASTAAKNPSATPSATPAFSKTAVTQSTPASAQTSRSITHPSKDKSTPTQKEKSNPNIALLAGIFLVPVALAILYTTFKHGNKQVPAEVARTQAAQQIPPVEKHTNPPASLANPEQIQPGTNPQKLAKSKEPVPSTTSAITTSTHNTAATATPTIQPAVKTDDTTQSSNEIPPTQTLSRESTEPATPAPIKQDIETEERIARLEALLAKATELAEKQVSVAAATPQSAPTANNSDNSSSSSNQAPATPNDSPKAKKQVNPDAVAFIESLKVLAIRFSGSEAKAMVENNRFPCQDVIRVGDIINQDTGLKVLSIKSKEIVFTDSGSVTYIKKF